MSEEVVVEKKKRGRPRKFVDAPKPKALPITNELSDAPEGLGVDFYPVFGLAAELLKAVVTARQGKLSQDSPKQIYLQVKELYDYCKNGLPEPPALEVPIGKNLSQENIDALNWDGDED